MKSGSLNSNHHRVPSLCAAVAITVVFVGCPRSENDVSGTGSGEQPFSEVVWLEEGIAYEDVLIDLGHRPSTSAGAFIEPAARITRDGSPVASAMVFCGIAPIDGAAVAGEVATVYEQAESAKDAIYAQGNLARSQGDATQIRFRVVLSGEQPAWTRDVALPRN